MPSFSSVMQLFLPTIYLFIPLFISLIRRTQARPEINVNTGYFPVEISPLNCFCFTRFFFFFNKKHISPKEKEGSRYFSDFYGSFSWFPQHSPVSGPDSNTSAVLRIVWPSFPQLGLSCWRNIMLHAESENLPLSRLPTVIKQGKAETSLMTMQRRKTSGGLGSFN